MNIEEVKKIVKSRLSSERYTHSLGVMKMAKSLAKRYHEDEEKAEITGLLHDIAKEMSEDEIYEYLKKYSIELDDIEKQNLGLVHAKIGACIAKEEFGLDEEAQNAILYHTTGKKKMNQFAKIIYVADKIEESRTYEGVEEIRKIAESDLDEVILISIEAVMKKSVKQRRLIHPDTIDTWNYIIGQKTTKI